MSSNILNIMYITYDLYNLRKNEFILLDMNDRYLKFQ